MRSVIKPINIKVVSFGTGKIALISFLLCFQKKRAIFDRLIVKK